MVNLSRCSCKKGQYFCFHLIGFLYLVGIVQNHASNEEEFINTYPVQPELLYN